MLPLAQRIDPAANVKTLPLLILRATDFDEELCAQLIAQYCTSDQAHRLRRFVQPLDRYRGLSSLLLQRCLIQTMFPEVPFDHALFDRAELGKPLVRHVRIPPTFDFNVSHDGDWTIIGFHVHSLFGVDIMDVRRVFEFDELRDQFSSLEWDRIEAAPDRAREFYHHWCLKESYIKAVGTGLSIEPHRVCFVHGVSIQVFVDDVLQAGWVFLPFDLDAAHIGCVALGPLAGAPGSPLDYAPPAQSPSATAFQVELFQVPAQTATWPVFYRWNSAQ